jgi:AraC-like DNA-binding protein
MTIPDVPRVQNPSDITRYFDIPSEDIIIDSSLCQWKNAFATIHKQSCDLNECHRPATKQHQLVLYRGATEHGEVSFNHEAWRKYTKRNNEWYIAPAGGEGSSWRWEHNYTQQSSQVFRILLPITKLEAEALIPKMGLKDDFMLQLALQLEAEMMTPSLFGPSYGETVSNLLSLYVLKHYAGITTANDLISTTFTSAKKKALQDYIMENLHTELSLNEIAQVVSLSKFHFARVFKNTFSIAPHQYIFLARMQLLETLLIESDAPLNLLAEKVGFAYSNNLVRAFRKFKGMTPMQYRKSMTTRTKVPNLIKK